MPTALTPERTDVIRPYDYYRANEWVAEKLSDVKATIETIEAYAKTRDARVFWRGQANHTWAFASSVVRKLSALTDVDDDVLQQVETNLLKEAADWIKELGAAPYVQPLARLAYLQHHGVPTRLLDITSDPWMAAFFAADSMDDVDGRMFALIVAQDAVLTKTPEGTPWYGYGKDEIKVYDPASDGIVFPRLAAQHGLFAIGRLPSTQPYREALDPELSDRRRALLAEEVRRILSIPFALSPLKGVGETDRIPTGASLPIGLTFRVHVDKASIRRDLAGAGAGFRCSPTGTTITHRTVYPDISGMVTFSKVMRGLERGVLIG